MRSCKALLSLSFLLLAPAVSTGCSSKASATPGTATGGAGAAGGSAAGGSAAGGSAAGGSAAGGGPGSVLGVLNGGEPMLGALDAPSEVLLDMQNDISQLAPGDVVKKLISGVLPSLDGNGKLLYVQEKSGTPAAYCRATLPDGAPDPSFGSNGCEEPPGESYLAQSVGVRALPGGNVLALVNPNCTNGCATGEDSFEMFRFTSAGQPDATFGNSGALYSNLAPQLKALAFDVQSTGKILVSGEAGGPKLFRLLANGALDTTFGSGGWAASAGADDFLHVLADDSFILVSSSNGINDVERYTKDGASDTSFGSGGRVDLTSVVPTGSDSLNIVAAHVDTTGRIYVAGNLIAGTSDHSPFVVRFLANGQLDPAFGQGGVVTALPSNEKMPSGMGEDADGNILVGFEYSNDIVRLAP